MITAKPEDTRQLKTIKVYVKYLLCRNIKVSNKKKTEFPGKGQTSTTYKNRIMN